MNAGTLFIGNKNYSSWSLRPWLLLQHFGVPFREHRLPLLSPTFHEAVGQALPAGKVPVLELPDGTRVWESLAICETVSERFLDGGGWPADPDARSVARSVSAEMHAGFGALRAEMPMNCRACERHVQRTPGLERDIERIRAIWIECRERWGASGPWLFGDFSIADAMYAPVVSRFQTYGVDAGPANEYMATLLEHPAMQRWYADAAAELEALPSMELGA
ncbi:glutathione S-transferase family protein [Ectothiorhodospiraceae bacterium WFHF3C12]|nr:glutathione S-transferase family protein [Ectothiorhodospiraceae bacterium WFHF3C12]